MQSFIDRFKAKASKAAQAQSRMKMLEKMTVITVPLAERTVPFKFYEVEELASPILELDKVDMGYAPASLCWIVSACVSISTTVSPSSAPTGRARRRW